MVHHRAFSLKNLGYWWEHRQTTERFHSRVLVTDGSTHTPQSVFTQRVLVTDGSTHTPQSVFTQVLATDGSTDRPQSVFTQESWLWMGAQTDRSVFPQESGILMWVQITVYFPSRTMDSHAHTDHKMFSLKNLRLTPLAPDRPSPPTLFPYHETPDHPVAAS